MILSNDGFVAFHYRSYGTFFLHKIGSIISIGDLPTTNIIEPFSNPLCYLVKCDKIIALTMIIKERHCFHKIQEL